jgi:hypothetical protein
MVPMPLASSDGRASNSSPAAAALSMFCSEPTTLTTPIGTITDRYVSTLPSLIARTRSPITGTGRRRPRLAVAACHASGEESPTPLTQHRTVPATTATRPPGRPPEKRTRPKYATSTMTSVGMPTIGAA